MKQIRIYDEDYYKIKAIAKYKSCLIPRIITNMLHDSNLINTPFEENQINKIEKQLKRKK